MSNQESNYFKDEASNKKRKSFSILEKLELIKEIEKDGTRVVGEKYNIPLRTLRTWKLEKDKLKEHLDNPRLKEGSKRFRTSILEELEEALYIWYDRSIRSGLRISGPQIITKARELHKDMQIIKGFVASEGWLSNWKKKFSIRLPIKSNEDFPLIIKSFQQQLREIINSEKLDLCQIFNAKSTCLYYKKMPKKTLNEDIELKESVTILLCSNADGSLKIPLLIIGKIPKSKVLGNLSVSNTQPVYYTNQRGAWMVDEIFKKWFKDEFVTKVTEFLKQKDLPPKALLLLDSAVCHSHIENVLGDIKILHIPVDETSLIQPMNQGIIEQFKKQYKALFILGILFAQKTEADIIEYLKTVTMRDVIYWSSYAWNTISQETIAHCWKKLLPVSINKNDKEIDYSITNTEISNYIRELNGYKDINEQCMLTWIFDNDLDFYIPSNSELIKMVTSYKLEDQSTENSSLCESICSQQAVHAADTLLLFCQEHEILSPEEQTILIKAKQAAMKIAIQI